MRGAVSKEELQEFTGCLPPLHQQCSHLMHLQEVSLLAEAEKKDDLGVYLDIP